MDRTPIPVPTAADAGIERRVLMSDHRRVVDVLVVFRYQGHKFEAAARSRNDEPRSYTDAEAMQARADCGAVALRAVQVQVEAYNRAILPPPPQPSTPDVPPCHFSAAILRPALPANPSTGSSRPTPAPRSTVSG